MSRLVDEVAIAMHDNEDSSISASHWCLYQPAAQAAINVILGKLREPTPEMCLTVAIDLIERNGGEPMNESRAILCEIADHLSQE
jgi:hypothetical protein